MSETQCTHDITEREVAAHDGYCPLCLASSNAALRADLKEARELLAWLREASSGHARVFDAGRTLEPLRDALTATDAFLARAKP